MQKIKKISLAILTIAILMGVNKSLAFFGGIGGIGPDEEITEEKFAEIVEQHKVRQELKVKMDVIKEKIETAISEGDYDDFIAARAEMKIFQEENKDKIGFGQKKGKPNEKYGRGRQLGQGHNFNGQRNGGVCPYAQEESES